jgi:hypothetical protein
VFPILLNKKEKPYRNFVINIYYRCDYAEGILINYNKRGKRIMVANIDMEIAKMRISLESSIAHNICQNLVNNVEFDVEGYVEECRNLFLTMEIDEYLVKEILDEAYEQGLLEYAMDALPAGVDAGAQIRPSENPRYLILAEELKALLIRFKCPK